MQNLFYPIIEMYSYILGRSLHVVIRNDVRVCCYQGFAVNHKCLAKNFAGSSNYNTVHRLFPSQPNPNNQ